MTTWWEEQQLQPKMLVISGDCKQFNVAWSADLDVGCMGDLVGGGAGGPNHTGMPLTDLDYVLWGTI